VCCISALWFWSSADTSPDEYPDARPTNAQPDQGLDSDDGDAHQTADGDAHFRARRDASANASVDAATHATANAERLSNEQPDDAEPDTFSDADAHDAGRRLLLAGCSWLGCSLQLLDWHTVVR
jgi:hypothetical protein